MLLSWFAKNRPAFKLSGMSKKQLYAIYYNTRKGQQ